MLRPAATCGSSCAGAWGVTIATPTPFQFLRDWSLFHGQAWAENAGWIRFNCADDASCAAVSYQAQTGWPDSDADGYTDAQEAALGKDPFTYCEIMRADLDHDGMMTIVDLSIEAGDFLKPIPPAVAREAQGPRRPSTRR